MNFSSQCTLLYLSYIQRGLYIRILMIFLSLIAQKQILNLQVKTDYKKGRGTHTESLSQLLSDIVSSGKFLDKFAIPTAIVLHLADSNNDQKK